MSEFKNPMACNAQEYINRCERRQERAAAVQIRKVDRFVRGLLRFSIVFFVWALTTSLLVGLAMR